ncbi:hypothetical protein BH780_gp221 [Bacillus phage Eldridge]|uniref:Uncharacterized protein n=1 Tax=Bacillus phage Eldridge TaxID=1776293 RepID=A0A110A2C8_9CAUD|nr:hypothetical protein BH780_gp221 [Bacillus phage Eldridge]AMB18804.1 hypothetical protein Eldridge_0224 [Bacillus phage Eldridge]
MSQLLVTVIGSAIGSILAITIISILKRK